MSVPEDQYAQMGQQNDQTLSNLMRGGFIDRSAQSAPPAQNTSEPTSQDLPPYRSFKNNNPGNIAKSNIAWQGKISGNDPTLETFATPEAGVGALAKNLLAYQNKHGLNTISGIINRWAPPSENDTPQLIQNASKRLGVKPDQPINLNDPKMLASFSKAIIHQENGIQPYDEGIIGKAVNGALGMVGISSADAAENSTSATKPAPTPANNSPVDVMSALDAASGSSAAEAQGVDIQSALDSASQQSPTSATETPQATTGTPLTAGESFQHGLGSMYYGLGDIAEHTGIPGLIRSAVGLPAVGGDEFDKIVSQREQDYNQARSASGQTGIDWWNLGGETLGSLPLGLPGAGEAAATFGGRMLENAGAGAAMAGAQPTAAGGLDWWGRAKNAAMGFAAGGLTSGAVEGLMGAVRTGIAAARGAIGKVGLGASQSAADSVVNSALQSKGINPNTVDLNLLSGMRQEVKDALTYGLEPSAEAIANRARAESLPVPVPLSKGQATRNPMQWQQEFNLRGVQGVGEPLQNLMQRQHAAVIQNLDVMGAKGAPTPEAMGNVISQKVNAFWDALQDKKNALYDAVKNSKSFRNVIHSLGLRHRKESKTRWIRLQRAMHMDYFHRIFVRPLTIWKMANLI